MIFLEGVNRSLERVGEFQDCLSRRYSLWAAARRSAVRPYQSSRYPTRVWLYTVESAGSTLHSELWWGMPNWPMEFVSTTRTVRKERGRLGGMVPNIPLEKEIQLEQLREDLFAASPSLHTPITHIDWLLMIDSVVERGLFEGLSSEKYKKLLTNLFKIPKTRSSTLGVVGLHPKMSTLNLVNRCHKLLTKAGFSSVEIWWVMKFFGPHLWRAECSRFYSQQEMFNAD